MFPMDPRFGLGPGGRAPNVHQQNFRPRSRSASRTYWHNRPQQPLRPQRNVPNRTQEEETTATVATANNKESVAVSAIKSIAELLCCGVCLERLPDTMVCCINGHVICDKCRRRLSNECPTCKGLLIPHRPTILCKIMEALPVLCRNAGCGEMASASDMATHENSCDLRMIVCKICKLSFRAKYLSNHASLHTLSTVKGNFVKHSIQIDKNTHTGNSSGKQDPREVCLVNKITRLWNVFGQHFWIVETINELSNSYIVELSWVPVGKHDAKEFVATIVIDPDSKESLCEAKQKLTRSNEVVFSFSLQLLKSFIESGGYVKHQLSLKKIT